MLEVNNVCVSFRSERQEKIFGTARNQVLFDVSLKVSQGTCLGILGESGSGKSTLGRVICGLLKPDTGEVKIQDVSVYASRNGRKNLQKRLSVVFQDYTTSANPRFRVKEIIAEGLVYLSILKWTFVLFIFSNLLIAMLRSVGTVRISFIVSVVSLIVNGCINYTLIFGHFGFPEMGIKGAAIGTLISRIAELLILLFYVAKMDTKIRLSSSSLFSGSREQVRSFLKVGIPIMITSLLWAVSVPMQTAILGHLSSDAIAANSVSSTFYQYLKVVVIALSSASAVMIGNSIGAGDLKRVRSDARTLSVIDILIGLILAAILFVCRTPLLSMYRLSNEAMILADHFMIIMSVIMVGMSYQMPVSMGIIQSSGDTKFTLRLNLISTWLIVMPLSFLAAFVWKWPVELVVVAVQCDQIFKGLPIFLRFRSYRWIHKLTA